MRDRKNRAVKASEWMVPMILFCIPGVNILAVLYYMLLGQNMQKRNWAKCASVILLVGYIFLLIFIVRLHNMSYAEFYEFVSLIFGK